MLDSLTPFSHYMDSISVYWNLLPITKENDLQEYLL